MTRWLIVYLCIAAAALSWGIYVPTVHRAAIELRSNLRAFLLVGVAYFVVAVMIPSLFIFVLKSDPTVKPGGAPNFAMRASVWGLAAGTAGAAGALCIIFATTQGGPGAALYVAPLVFAGAPIVNTVATILYFHPAKALPDWKFFAGLAFAIVGAAMVMLFKPLPVQHTPAPGGTTAAGMASEGAEEPE